MMKKKNKYEPLTEWLAQRGEETVKLSLAELNDIIPIPPSAYKYSSSWANCTTKNSTSFQQSWLKAGYRAFVKLDEQRIEFSKNAVAAAQSRQTSAGKSVEPRSIPVTFEEEILLAEPDKLSGMAKDKFLMVRLTKENSDIVEGCLNADKSYQSKGKAVMERHFNAGDYSKEAYYDIIRCIAAENSTRTPKETMECLAAYCADRHNRFLARVKEGDQSLVDALLRHLEHFRKDKSLASKICRYLNEWLVGGHAYTINDSVMRTVLPYYLAFYDIDREKWQGKDWNKFSYEEFYDLFSKVRDKTDGLNNHQLDHLIWYTYKNDGIRREIAKALAKIM